MIAERVSFRAGGRRGKIIVHTVARATTPRATSAVISTSSPSCSRMGIRMIINFHDAMAGEPQGRGTQPSRAVSLIAENLYDKVADDDGGRLVMMLLSESHLCGLAAGSIDPRGRGRASKGDSSLS